ncbi:uncharacterized protein LOC125757865 [Rhipicephalus sanguineus]|uniref:uncharacterized protein LOC125757865 n=1 Tax=Rhipicephalus sanguineus TaxID=34632 RepID=UPI0020C561F7|nr:uncharacterized protein LOC125757865 [Rhipicephalus sanguineus]
MFTNLFAVATTRTMGWFYVAFIEEFSLNRQTSSWPGFLVMCCHRTSGLLVGMLHKHMSLFLIGLMGSFLAWGGMAASAFAPSISWMSFTMGIVHGIGAGVVIQSHTVVVLQHFSKYRGLAAGSMFTANPTSAILFPAVLSALNDAYGFRGAVLVYGALIMHISALCPILKEPPWITNAGTMRENGVHENQRLRKTYIDSTGCDVKLLAKSDEPAAAAFSIEKILYEARRRSASSLKADTLELEDNVNTVEVASIEYDALGRRCFQQTEEDISVCRRSTTFRIPKSNHSDSSPLTAQDTQQPMLPHSANSSTSPHGCPEKINQHKLTEEHSQKTSQSYDTSLENEVSITRERRAPKPAVSKSRLSTDFRELLRRILRSVVPTRFSTTSFAVAVLGSTLVDYVNTVHIYTMVDYACDKGVSRTHATMSITYAAPPEILGRLLVPLIADMGWLSRPFLACGCAITAGLLFAVTPETVQIAHLVLRALSSVTMGALATMKTVLVADYMGTDAVCVVSGVSGSLLVPLMLCNPLIFATLSFTGKRR